jgi:hypothetical protein
MNRNQKEIFKNLQGVVKSPLDLNKMRDEIKNNNLEKIDELLLQGGTSEFIRDIQTLMAIYEINYIEITPLTMDAKLELYSDKSKRCYVQYCNIKNKK